jgi:hypothetical protein
MRKLFHTLLFLIIPLMLGACALKFMYGVQFEFETAGDEVAEHIGKEEEVKP